MYNFFLIVNTREARLRDITMKKDAGELVLLLGM